MAGASPAVNVVVFSAREYDRVSFEKELAKRAAGATQLKFEFIDKALNADTVKLAAGATMVVPFVNDDLSAPLLAQLAGMGVRAIALRCAGFNNVDLATAEQLKIAVLRVPAYSPTSVAEHAVALLMALNRHLKKSVDRSRHGNFDLQGLVGRDISSLTVGVVGTGKIGYCFAKIMHGFGAKILAHDVYESQDAKDKLGVTYVPIDELLTKCDVISLHCNLTPENKHMFNDWTFNKMKKGAILINTARGGLIDTRSAITALKSGQLGALGVDVVEEEADCFFRYRELDVPDELARLLLFNNVIVTGHQAFLTEEALSAIAAVTISNIDMVLAAAAEGKAIAAGPTVVHAA